MLNHNKKLREKINKNRRILVLETEFRCFEKRIEEEISEIKQSIREIHTLTVSIPSLKSDINWIKLVIKIILPILIGGSFSFFLDLLLKLILNK